MADGLGLGLGLVTAPIAFLLPGWLLARRFALPRPLLGGFLISCLLWFHLVVAADAMGWRLTRPLLLGAWAVLSALLFLAARAQLESAGEPSSFPRPRGADWWWVAAAGAGLLSIAVRAIVDPLSGWDNAFRWDFLAHAVIELGNLHFYPPVSAADFERYAWCDGIPPLVSLLNVWLYLVTGSSQPAVTAVRVIGEALLIGGAVFSAARRWWGDRGAWPAVGVLGTSALFLWGVAMGQESGLLALAVITIVGAIQDYHIEGRISALILAALAAALAALTRDYGGAFLVLAAASLLCARKFRAAAWFLALSLALCGPWYLRNAILTGNPLFPHEVHGVLRGQPAQREFLDVIGRYWRWGSSHIRFDRLLLNLAETSGLVWALGLAGLWIARKRAALMAATILIVIGLWAWSVPQTAGGINYSLRVLTPLLPLLAVTAGWAGTFSSPRYGRSLLFCALLLGTLDATRRSWLLPTQPAAAPLPWSFAPWREAREMMHAADHALPWERMVQLGAGRVTIVDSAECFAQLHRRGARAAMLFSPQTAVCFDDTKSIPTIAAELRSDSRLLVLSAGDPIMGIYFREHRFFRELTSLYQPALEAGSFAIYDLDALVLRR